MHDVKASHVLIKFVSVCPMCFFNLSHIKIFLYFNVCVVGLLHVGDEILEVAGKSVRDQTPNQVVHMLVGYFIFMVWWY